MQFDNRLHVRLRRCSRMARDRSENSAVRGLASAVLGSYVEISSVLKSIRVPAFGLLFVCKASNTGCFLQSQYQACEALRCHMKLGSSLRQRILQALRLDSNIGLLSRPDEVALPSSPCSHLVFQPSGVQRSDVMYRWLSI